MLQEYKLTLLIKKYTNASPGTIFFNSSSSSRASCRAERRENIQGIILDPFNLKYASPIVDKDIVTLTAPLNPMLYNNSSHLNGHTLGFHPQTQKVTTTL